MSVTRVILPKLGLTMDEGRLVAWHKREGERVMKGEVLFEVETDKATMEVEASAAGVVRRLLLPAGDSAPVATVIALISDTPDEPLPDLPGPSPALAAATPSIAQHVRPADPLVSSNGERVRSSPAARKRAQELGVDINAVRGTGPGGRINIEDVESAASSRAAPPSAPSGADSGETRIPLTRMRRAVAETMARSAREAPQFSISRDVDMTAANERRKSAGVSYTDVIVAAAAKALRAHPRLRSRFDGDAVIESDRADIGIAVALEEGLIVPVLRAVDRKDLVTLRDERESLETAARSGHLRADAFGGATLTVSNLGTFGVDRFTAIVNPPEASILAVGRVAERVTVANGGPAVRPVVSLTLSVDHRVADGADAARFLADVARYLES